MKAHRIALVLGATWLGSGSVMAADLPVPAETVEIVQPFVEPRWSFSIAPYVWAAGISGDVAAFGLPTVDIDASFSDIFDNLDFAAMLVSELRYGRFGIFTDLAYVKLSGATGTPFGVLADRVGLDAETLAFTAAGEYRVLETPGGSLDLMAGARVWSVDTTVSVSGGLLGSRERSDGDTWVDPLIGAKGRFDLTERFYLTGWAMAGGFGASSDFMWDLWGGAGYQFNNRFSAVLGYRGMGVDYENDGFVFDVIQHGPVIGGVVRF
jgi:hypothetical protein